MIWNSITDILIFFSFTFGCFYLWMKYQFSYWKNKNVPYIKPKFLSGNLNDILMFRESAATGLANMYFDNNTKNEPIVGIHIFHKPGLIIKNLDLIKMILVKDFNKFSNRYSSSDPHSDLIGANALFFVKTPLWKKLRSNLTPFFTSGKMKQMFHLMNEIGKNLENYLQSISNKDEAKSLAKCVDIKELCALYTTDIIGTIAFGIESNCIKNPKSEFRYFGKQIFNFTLYRAIEFTSFFFIPQIVSIFKFKTFSNETTNFLKSTVQYVMDEREKSGTSRNDLIDLLLKFKNSTSSNEIINDENDVNDKNTKLNNDFKYDINYLAAQASVFFSAGFETASSLMSFCLYELSKNSLIQNKLRDEIKNTMKNNNSNDLNNNNNEITYDLIQKMEYLDQVVKEVLRLYPPLPFLDRECQLNKNDKFEYNQGYSLQPHSTFKIPDGMPVYIPIFAIQRDPKYFPNPNVFDPDRFSPENKSNIHPYSYMPFGFGPRICIGERFGLMQAKIGLVYFLKNHYVKPSIKTQNEMKLNRKALIIQAEGGIYCDIVRDEI